MTTDQDAALLRDRQATGCLLTSGSSCPCPSGDSAYDNCQRRADRQSTSAQLRDAQAFARRLADNLAESQAERDRLRDFVASIADIPDRATESPQVREIVRQAREVLS